MKFDVFVRRPVLALVINTAIVLVGIMGYRSLSVRQIPNIETPVVTVATVYQGANAAIVESQITKPIEDAVAGIEGVDFVQSISRSGQSQVTITFKASQPMEVATADVRDRVERAKANLPPEALDPVVQKQEADAQAIIYLAVFSERHSTLEVSEAANTLVRNRLQTIPGVAEARVYSSRYAMRIWLDAQRMAAVGVTPGDIEAALRSENVEVPAGTIEGRDREFTIHASAGLETPTEFAGITVKEAAGRLVKLGDVAEIELGGDFAKYHSRYNGNTAVPVGIARQAMANPVEISDALREALPQIAADLPDGMKVEVAYDTTIFIKKSISNVLATILEALVLVGAVILLMLRNWRTALIPFVAVPISLLGTAAFMHAAGFSINTLSLLAMVLAIGLVVDDAIVVLENTYRKVEAGLPPLEAALNSLGDVGFAIVAMTLTLGAVYLPLAFASGRTGKLFTEFAMTLAFAVVVSGVTAMTLTPVLCAKFLRPKPKPDARRSESEKLSEVAASAYQSLVRGAIRRRWIVIASAFAMVFAGGFAWVNLPRELAPGEDQGMIIGLASAPVGSTLAFTDRHARKIEGILHSVPEGNRMFELVGINGPTSAVGFVGLVDWAERSRTAQQISAELMPELSSLSGVLAFPTTPPPLGHGGVGQPVSMVIQTTGSWDELDESVKKIVQGMKESGRFSSVDTDLKLNMPELDVDIDAEKVAAIGGNYGDVANTLQAMFGGRRVSRFSRGTEQYDVIMQVADEDRATPAALGHVQFRNRDGEMIPLGNVIRIDEVAAAKELNHFNKMRAATITAGLAPGSDQGEALEWLKAEARRLVPDVLVDFSGQSREYREASKDFPVLIFLAVVFIYLVLAAQFESILDPVVILVSAPLAVAAAFLALFCINLGEGAGFWSQKTSWNIYTQIGVITLVGLIAKHGILIVEFANQLCRQGADRVDAIVSASSARMRPVLMTTGAMVLGAVPLALAAGAGAEARQQIGWTIVGGLVIGTAMTMIIVPVMYVALGSMRKEPIVTMQAATVP